MKPVRWFATYSNKVFTALALVAFAAAASVLLLHSKAATPTASLEPENGTLASSASVTTDTSASGGGAVKFSAASSFDTSLLPLAPAGKTWGVVFNDEFNGTSLDTTKWITCNPSAYACGPPFNGEQQLYTPQNVTVSGGFLHLIARKETTSGPTSTGGTKSYSYTSGMISSGPDNQGYNNAGYKGFQYQYGYYQSRVKLPAGNGFWPSEWMKADQDKYGTWPGSGEYDMYEVPGNDPTELHMTEHDGNNGGAGDGVTKHVADLSAGFHVFGFDWEPDHLAWYLDGQLARTMICTDAYATSHPGNCDSYRYATAIQTHPFYLIANRWYLAAAGQWGRCQHAVPSRNDRRLDPLLGRPISHLVQ